MNKTMPPVLYPVGIQSFAELRRGGYVYVDKTELIHKTAQAAIDQIERKRYWEKFLMREKEIYLIGANFDTATRRLDDYIILHKTQESGL